MAVYSIRQASAQLGVTTQTVRRRIREGKVAAFQIDGKFGAEWRVDLDEPPPITRDLKLWLIALILLA